MKKVVRKRLRRNPRSLFLRRNLKRRSPSTSAGLWCNLALLSQLRNACSSQPLDKPECPDHVEHWANDVSRDVAQEIQLRCDVAGEPVPEYVRDFVEARAISTVTPKQNRVALARL